jgi:peroxiredoxin
MATRTSSNRAKNAGGGKPASAKPGRGKPTAKRRPTVTGGRLRASRWPIAVIVLIALVAGAGLYWVYRSATHTASGTASGSGYPYAVGQPGVGAQAPAFTLASTAGGPIGLASLRDQNVLLYFQEGLSCQPCWDQIKDLEKHTADLKAAGIDKVVSITSDPVNLLTQKVHDMGLSTTVLSDPDLAVSTTYHANDYGMMGDSRDGHTFILVARGGSITWRADYGGAPKFTMFVPASGVLTDLRNATKTGAGATP